MTFRVRIQPSNKKFQDITGETFGRLTVKHFSGKDKWGKVKWVCECSCGCNEIEVIASKLKSGHTRSCGCLQRDAVRQTGKDNTGRFLLDGKKLNREGIVNNVSGESHSVEYITWRGMLERCSDKRSNTYKNYGGRGIKVCERWHTYRNFLKDMGRRPSNKNSIDRIDVNGDYCPENCRWADDKQQGRNRRNNSIYEHDGRKQCLVEWSEELDIKYQILLDRLGKLGWSVEKAFTTPENEKAESILVDFRGEKRLLSELANEYNQDRRMVYRRVLSGWSVEKALTVTKAKRNRRR